jgi:hypothetical protein
MMPFGQVKSDFATDGPYYWIIFRGGWRPISRSTLQIAMTRSRLSSNVPDDSIGKTVEAQYKSPFPAAMIWAKPSKKE